MFQYQPPAKIDDLTNDDKTERPTRTEFLKAWHEFMQEQFNTEVRRLPNGNKYFFTEATTAATSAELPVTWNAFPLSITRHFPDSERERWTAADKLVQVNRGFEHPVMMPCRLQDEYCEWHAYTEGPGGPIKRIVFTAEAPEYWIELARHDFDKVVELYKKWVSPDVHAEDLKLTQDINFGGKRLYAGTYNPYNAWNTVRGCMHLTHPANTLGAEINLAAGATIPRKDRNGERITEVRRFACASDFGDPNRSSDPNIGQGVNLTVWPGAAKAKAQSVTLANPVALYLDHIDPDTITDDQGNALPDWFKIERGDPGRGLMAVFEAPLGSTIGIDKIRVEGRPVEFGGQLADQIQMVLYAKTGGVEKDNPIMRPASFHCCMEDKGIPAQKQNFEHTDTGSSCAEAGLVEAFDELQAGPVIGAGMAPEEPPQKRSAHSRMNKPLEKGNG